MRDRAGTTSEAAAMIFERAGGQVVTDISKRETQAGIKRFQPGPRAGLGAILGLLPLVSAPLLEAAQTRAADIVATECVACHGLDGNSPIPSFPKLAGLQREYLEKQLIELANGVRRSEVMKPIAEKYTRAELIGLAQYFSGQSRKPGAATDPALIEQGLSLYHEGNKVAGVPACAGCHKPDGSGTPRSPLLAGQDPAYTLQQLRHFDEGVRNNDRGRLMRTVAGRMSPEEMRAVSEYIASMPVTPR
jgi:cytochrome c553